MPLLHIAPTGADMHLTDTVVMAQAGQLAGAATSQKAC